MIAAAGHELAARAIVKDDVEAIRAQVRAWIADESIDVVISTGGTGFTGRDVTPEAVRPLFEKEIDGFSTVFHMISFREGRHLHHPVARLRRPRPRHLHLLPARLARRLQDAWNGILVHQLDNRHRPCNLVEIMPRLEEHRRKGVSRGQTPFLRRFIRPQPMPKGV